MYGALQSVNSYRVSLDLMRGAVPRYILNGLVQLVAKLT